MPALKRDDSRVQDQIIAVKIRQNLPRPRRMLMDQISSSDQRMSASALHKLQAPREDWVRSAQIVRLRVAAFLLGIAPVRAREVIMNASRSIAPSEKLVKFFLKPGPAVATTETRYSVDQPLQAVATGLAELLETARRELEHDRELAKASLIAASDILHAEIERLSGAKDFQRGCLVAWQVVRVRDYVDGNLHRPIHVRDLCAVARLSPAHFSRKFKLSFGETPLAYVARMRLKKACHLMITSKATLSEIALRAGFSDQAHLCRQFKRAFSQSPATWRRELDLHVGRCPFGSSQADRLNHLSEGVALVDWGPEYAPDASSRREC